MILEAIYRGNYTPLDLVIPTDPEYAKSNIRVNDLQDQLMVTLEPDQKQILKDLIDEIHNSTVHGKREIFQICFRIRDVAAKRDWGTM